MRKTRCALLLTLFLAGLAPLGASPLPKGEIFRVDAAPDCRDFAPEVAALPGGGYFAVWVGPGDPLDAESTAVYGRLFGAAGDPLGPEMRLSQGGRTLTTPSVAADASGRFLVVWNENFGRIAGRLFDPSGAPAGPERTLGFGGGGFMTVAALPQGGFGVVWTDFGVSLLRVGSDGLPVGEPVVVEDYSGFFFESQPFPVTPSVAVQGDGDLVLVWVVQDAGLQLSRLAGKIIPANAIRDADRDRWTELEIDPPGGSRWLAAATAGVDGADNIVVAWQEDLRLGGSPRRLQVMRLDPRGQPLGAPVRVDNGAVWTRLLPPRIAVANGGDFVLAWPGVPADGAAGAPTAIYARSFSRDLQAASEPVEIAPAAGHGRSNPALALSRGGSDGGALVLWQEGEPYARQGCFTAGIAARRVLTGCVPGEGRLCLGDGRFQLLSAFSTPRDGVGAGQGVTVSRDTGYFWFFGPENVELMVKVLDGRAINGKFWVFYGSLSNVAWTLKVTDLLTEAGKTYQNPANQLASRGDTAALPGNAGDAAGGAADSAETVEVRAFESLALDREALPAPASAAEPAVADAMPIDAASPLVVATAPLDGLGGPCNLFPITTPVPTRPGLCLNDQRFEVEVTWRDPFNGGSGVGQGVGLTGDSGYFWFFDPSNVELVVKVLDGRSINGKYWVFYGALTNVEYDLKVHPFDTEAERTYHNPPFQFRSVADTGAFDSNGN